MNKYLISIFLIGSFFLTGCGNLTDEEIIKMIENGCIKTNIQNLSYDGGNIILEKELEIEFETECDNYELRQTRDGETGLWKKIEN